MCVECGRRAAAIIQTLHPGNVRLARCDGCGCCVDKYLERDSFLILLDVLLHRPSAYRHVLCNRTEALGTGPGRLKSLALVVICDAYLKRAIEASLFGSCSWDLPLTHLLIGFGWPLLSALLEFLAFSATASGVACALLALDLEWQSTAGALLLSSVGKAFVLLHMIWEYPLAFAAAIELFVLTCQAVALSVHLQCNVEVVVRTLVVAVAARVGLSMALLWASRTLVVTCSQGIGS